MQITMDMVSGSIEGDSSENKNEETAELSYARYNTALALVAVGETQQIKPSIPASLADIDVDDFLARMYSSQEG